MDQHYYNYYYSGSYHPQYPPQQQQQQPPQQCHVQPPPKENYSWCRKRQFHHSMKMLQENVVPPQHGSHSQHQKAKSTTGNLLGLNNPLGNTESYQHLSGGESNSTSSPPHWNTVTNLHPYHHPPSEEDQSKDEELTSMLQRYLDPNDGLDFQKSPGQLSSDSGFSDRGGGGCTNGTTSSTGPTNDPHFDLNEYEDNGEDLSQLVDQVLNSIDVQFPEDPYLTSLECSSPQSSTNIESPRKIEDKKVGGGKNNGVAKIQLPDSQTNAKKRTVGVVEPRVVIKPTTKTNENSETESHQPPESTSDPSLPKKRKLEETPEIELPEDKKKIEEEKKSQRQQLIKKLEAESKNLKEPKSADQPSKEPFVVYNFKGLPTFSNPIEEQPSPKSPEPKPKKKIELKIEPETDGKWLYCSVSGCPFWTRKQIRMERHMKSHIPGEDKFYQCPECQLKICSLSKLLRHDRKFHTGFKDYECKICEAEVTDIAVHMRVHRTEKQFTCHVCKLQFRHKNSLVRHLFQHSGERPFRCQNCESGFTSINRLKEHIKKKHPDTPAAKSIMEPLVAIPNNTSSKTHTHSTNTKFTPIAPAPVKIPAAQPQPVFLPQPTQSLPILTPGPNGTMLLMNTNTFMIPQMVPQLVLSQPLIYGMPYGTIPMSTNVIPSNTIQNTSGTLVANTITSTKSDEITILNTTSSSPPAKMNILERAMMEISEDAKT